MRKYVIALAVVAALVAAWATTSTSAISSPQVFTLLAVDSGTAQPINGFAFDRAPRAGDQFNPAGNLYTWAGGKRGAKVGTAQGLGTFLTVTKSGGSVLFTRQWNLSGGWILGGGVLNYKNGPESKFKLAVTGGTGTYENVRGYVIGKVLPGQGNKAFFEFHLLP